MFPELKAKKIILHINIDIDLRGLLLWFSSWISQIPFLVVSAGGSRRGSVAAAGDGTATATALGGSGSGAAMQPEDMFFHWILDAAGWYWVMEFWMVCCEWCVPMCDCIFWDVVGSIWLYDQAIWKESLKIQDHPRQFAGAIWTAPTLGTKGEGTARTGTRAGATWQRVGSES